MPSAIDKILIMDTLGTIRSLETLDQYLLGKKLGKYTNTHIREWCIKSRKLFAFIMEVMSEHMVCVAFFLFFQILEIKLLAHQKKRKTLFLMIQVCRSSCLVWNLRLWEHLMNIFTVWQGFIENDKLCRFLLFFLEFSKKFFEF